jgi:hypothetical protein
MRTLVQSRSSAVSWRYLSEQPLAHPPNWAGEAECPLAAYCGFQTETLPANEIRGASQQDVVALGARFVGDGRALPPGRREIPGRGEARLDGIAVATSPGRMFPGLVTPSSASVSCRAGIPRRGIPGTYPADPIATAGFPMALRERREPVKASRSRSCA